MALWGHPAANCKTSLLFFSDGASDQQPAEDWPGRILALLQQLCLDRMVEGDAREDATGPPHPLT